MDLRQYDPAIARFIALDPIVHHSQSPYTAFDNNPIYWADPSGMSGEHYDYGTGTYKNDQNETISFEDAMSAYGLNTNGSEKTKENNNEASSDNTTTGDNKDIHPRGNDFKNRPRTTMVVKQLYDYVKNHPSVLETLAEYSGYSTMEVLEQLKYKKGDVILGIESLDWHKLSPEGITITSRDIRLAINSSNKLEVAKTNEKIQSTSFFIAVTILHEFVHAGRKANKMDKNGEKYEMGWGWELRVFGKSTTPSNASEMYKKYDWNFKY